MFAEQGLDAPDLLLTAEGGISPEGKRDPSFLTRIRVGRQSATQELLTPIQRTEVIDAALKDALRIDHGVADRKGARPLGYHATESVCSVEVLLVCRAGVWW